jgi:aspartyl-tRNA(Asn)/glutamyl-tRNA(Gln) amidotransferase subunit A
VTGFKATYGLLPVKGILAGEEADETILRLAHTAFMCRTAQDAAIILNAIAIPGVSESAFAADYSSALSAPADLRIGIAKGYKASVEVETAFSKTTDIFRLAGYTVIDLTGPIEFPTFDIRNIEEDRKAISNTMFKDIDVLLLPTTTDVTPTIAEALVGGPQAVSAENTFFCNYYGLPAISIPCGLSKSGLPLGFQIVGPTWGEGVILELAHQFQQATHWHINHPHVSMQQSQ